jgi:hypothetical protein
MGEIERNQRRLGLEDRMREYEMRRFGITLFSSVSTQCASCIMHPHRSVLLLVREMISHGVGAHIELSISGPVSKSLAFALHFAHRRICEAAPNSPTHDREAFEVTR